MSGGADILSAVRRPLGLPLVTMDSLIMAQSDQHRHSLFVIGKLGIRQMAAPTTPRIGEYLNLERGGKRQRDAASQAPDSL